MVKWLFILLLFVNAFCYATEKKGPLFVTLPPLKFVLQKLLTHDVDIVVLLGDGQNPHQFELSPKVAIALSHATAFFTIGLPIEENMVKRTISSNKVFSLDLNIKKIKNSEHEDEKHGHHHDHDHGEYDPHVWTSFDNLKEIAKNGANYLSEIYPERKSEINLNKENFLKEINLYQSEANQKLKRCENKVFFTTHSSLLYFSKEFKIKENALQEEGKSFGPQKMEKFFSKIKENKAKLFLYRKNLDDLIKEKISKNLDLVLYPFNPIEEDVLLNLKNLVNIFAENC